jgi:SAM-dependent methyltransferase
MGDNNQLAYLRTHLAHVDGAILEIGSKDYGSTANFRGLFASNPYVGVDMAAGPGVDRVLDLTTGTGDLPLGAFALGICCSVLEHTDRPWQMAEHMTALIRPGGSLFLSVPWVWRYHAYPDDYFRFSWRGIEALFPAFEWQHKVFSTNVPGEFLPIGTGAPWPDDRMARWRWTWRGRRKYLPYLLVNMLGVKRS